MNARTAIARTRHIRQRIAQLDIDDLAQQVYMSQCYQRVGFVDEPSTFRLSTINPACLIHAEGGITFTQASDPQRVAQDIVQFELNAMDAECKRLEHADSDAQYEPTFTGPNWRRYARKLS